MRQIWRQDRRQMSSELEESINVVISSTFITGSTNTNQKE